MKVSVIGAGTMGMGIAQIAATQGHKVCLYDSYDGAIENANKKIEKILNRLIEKERITSKEKEEIIERIHFSKKLHEIGFSADYKFLYTSNHGIAKKNSTIIPRNNIILSKKKVYGNLHCKI